EVLEFVRAEVAKERQARNRNIALGVSLPVITAAAAYGGYRLWAARRARIAQEKEEAARAAKKAEKKGKKGKNGKASRRHQPRDASSRGVARAVISARVNALGGIGRGQIRIMTPEEVITTYNLPEGLVRRITAEGIRFARAPPAWNLGIANQDGFIILPSNPQEVTQPDVIHEENAILNPELEHDQIEVLTKQPFVPSVAGKQTAIVVTEGSQPSSRELTPGSLGTTNRLGLAGRLLAGFGVRTTIVLVTSAATTLLGWTAYHRPELFKQDELVTVFYLLAGSTLALFWTAGALYKTRAGKGNRIIAAAQYNMKEYLAVMLNIAVLLSGYNQLFAPTTHYPLKAPHVAAAIQESPYSYDDWIFYRRNNDGTQTALYQITGKRVQDEATYWEYHEIMDLQTSLPLTLRQIAGLTRSDDLLGRDLNDWLRGVRWHYNISSLGTPMFMFSSVRIITTPSGNLLTDTYHAVTSKAKEYAGAAKVKVVAAVEGAAGKAEEMRIHRIKAEIDQVLSEHKGGAPVCSPVHVEIFRIKLPEQEQMPQSQQIRPEEMIMPDAMTSQPRDASSRGVARAVISARVNALGGIGRGQIRIMTPEEVITTYNLPEGLVRRITAEGIRFARAPPAWNLGIANQDGFIILPSNPQEVTQPDVIHEENAILNPELEHDQIEVLTKQPFVPSVAGKQTAIVVTEGSQPSSRELTPGSLGTTYLKTIGILGALLGLSWLAGLPMNYPSSIGKFTFYGLGVTNILGYMLLGGLLWGVMMFAFKVIKTEREIGQGRQEAGLAGKNGLVVSGAVVFGSAILLMLIAHELGHMFMAMLLRNVAAVDIAIAPWYITGAASRPKSAGFSALGRIFGFDGCETITAMSGELFVLSLVIAAIILRNPLSRLAGYIAALLSAGSVKEENRVHAENNFAGLMHSVSALIFLLAGFNLLLAGIFGEFMPGHDWVRAADRLEIIKAVYVIPGLSMIIYSVDFAYRAYVRLAEVDSIYVSVKEKYSIAKQGGAKWLNSTTPNSSSTTSLNL
ncbi:MAG: hypothetical protein PHQ43_13725, partial [Dehalococcoidales bacterium]|nr:hypothetical protein [Dehalococcoidales bacterium]